MLHGQHVHVTWYEFALLGHNCLCYGVMNAILLMNTNCNTNILMQKQVYACNKVFMVRSV